MSETKAGNLAAIRDWGDHYFYSKTDICDFFMKINAGLSAYKLTILSSKNSTVNIVEDAASDPQTYNVQTDNSGIYTGLFFFTAGSDVTFTCGSKSTTVTLTNSVMIINVNDYVISDLIPNAPAMNDSHILESSRFDDSHSGFIAFNKNISGGSYDFVTAAGNSPSFIGYHFDTPVICTNVKIYSWTTWATSQNIRTVTVQGSNDGINWVDLVDITVEMLAYQSQAFLTEADIPDLTTYTYLRLYQNSVWRPNDISANNPDFNVRELYFYGYIPSD